MTLKLPPAGTTTLFALAQVVFPAVTVQPTFVEVAVPELDEKPPHGPPESVEAWSEGYRSGPAYHVLGVEARSPIQPGARRGPGWAWFRLKLPVVPDEA